MKKNRVFIEASGSPVTPSLISELKKINIHVTSSDISDWNAGASLSDEYLKVPNHKNPNLWKILIKILKKKKINWVIPSFDETLSGWADNIILLKKKNINVILSLKETIDIFLDKWLTYKAFLKARLPTPHTSLEKKYNLIKPRKGRGSKGILITKKKVKMTGLISQQLLTGREFTTDCLFDLNGNAIYIVSRMRNRVVDGKSTSSKIFKNEKIKKYILRLSKFYKFIGPINLQGFIKNDKVKFTELNPRIAGGMALSWAGTENWFNLWFKKIIYNKKIKIKKIKFNLKMDRYYSEIFY